MTLYLDLTLILNGIVCWIAFSITEFVLNFPANKGRKLLACVLGSFYVILYLAWYSLADILLLKLSFVMLTVLVCFGYYSFKRLLEQTACVIVFTASFSGLLFMVMTSLSNGKMAMPNPYIDLKNFLYLTIFLASFVIIPPFFRVFILNIKRLTTSEKMTYELEVWLNNKTIKINGFVDTGNSLVDPISNLPVIIVDRQVLKGKLSSKWDNWLESGKSWNVPDCDLKIRYVPVNTIAGTSLMIIFKPQKVFLVVGDKKRKVKALVGVNPQNDKMVPGFEALIHPSILCNIDNL
ncbi:sigma-E processing peptidase SpoIIGA [Proteinivorax tanatarense]|uniref:Sporulation sigma-E factor-processing peptidase n=1 Tax=Proteinivorax tanatarense TaxID=1260629 RepID=A0AAU7VPY3_9FIRM